MSAERGCEKRSRERWGGRGVETSKTPSKGVKATAVLPGLLLPLPRPASHVRHWTRAVTVRSLSPFSLRQLLRQWLPRVLLAALFSHEIVCAPVGRSQVLSLSLSFSLSRSLSFLSLGSSQPSSVIKQEGPHLKAIKSHVFILICTYHTHEDNDGHHSVHFITHQSFAFY